jgi:endoglycosylceramidase
MPNGFRCGRLTLPCLLAGALACGNTGRQAPADSTPEPDAPPDLQEDSEARSAADAGPIPLPYSPNGFVGSDGRSLRDEKGRILLLRGVNVANQSKVPPFLPLWFTQQHFLDLAARGLNAVRFLVIWEAVEPERGVFDAAYLDAVEERVGWATDAGLYVLVDMHQDLFARTFGGDGAPEWAVLDHGLPFDPPPGDWFLAYGEPAVKQAFQSFWDNEEGIQDEFILAWRQVAARFEDNPRILGYDLLNEPFPGLMPVTRIAEFEKDVLTPFYSRVIEGIRKEDSVHLVFVEPTATKGLGVKGGLEHPGDPAVVYAPHYYHPTMDLMGAYWDTKESMLDAFAQMQIEAQALGAPLFLGEYGFFAGNKGDALHARHQAEVLEETLASSTAWGADPCAAGLCLYSDDGQPLWPLDFLSVPFPAATNAALQSWHYDRTARTLSVRIDETGWEQGVTEIVLPEPLFPHGAHIECAWAGAPVQCPQATATDGAIELTTGGPSGRKLDITVRPDTGNPLPLPGVSTHIALGNAASQEAELAMEQAAGLTWIRRDFYWSQIEPSPGQWSFEPYDSLVDHAAEHGIEIVGLLVYSVTWAEAVPGDFSTIDEDAFAQFAGTTAAHFAGRISTWEIWNEPNLKQFFPPQPDPAKYGRLLAAAAKAIRIADPSARILVGGLSSTDVVFGLGFSFFEQVAQATPSIAQTFDALGIHPYTLGQSLAPDQDNPAGDLTDMLLMARASLAAYGQEHKPLSITELGWPACPCPPRTPPGAITPNASYQEQASWLVRSYVLSAAFGVDMFLWYDFMDEDGSIPTFSENWFGLVRHDPDPSDDAMPVPKPAYHAFKTLVASLSGRTWRGTVSTSTGCNAHLFDGPPGPVIAAWSQLAEGSCSVLLPPGWPEAILAWDMVAAPVQPQAEDGQLVLDASQLLYLAPQEL